MTLKPKPDSIQLPDDSPIVPFVCYVGHSQDVYSLLPWNEFLLSGSRDKTIRVWKGPSPTFNVSRPYNANSECIGLMSAHTDNIRALIARQNIIISISWDKSVKIWKWKEDFWKKYRIGPLQQEVTVPTSSVYNEFAPAATITTKFLSKIFSGLFVSKKTASSDNSSVSSDRVVNFATSETSSPETEVPLECLKSWIAHPDWIVSTCIWNGWLCTGGFEGCVGIWEIEDENNLGQEITKLERHSNYVGALGVVGTKLWSAGYDGCIKIWNTNFQLEKSLEGTGKHPFVSFYNDNDTTIYTGCGNGRIYVWSPEGVEMACLEAHHQSLNSILRWSNLLLTGCESGQMTVWTKEKEEDKWKPFSKIQFPKFVKKIVIWKNRVWISSGNNIYGFKGAKCLTGK